jgi:5-methylthioadenosine/S-adenosylhomocysteine deaminase
MQRADCLITNGLVVTMDAAGTCIASGAVLVKSGRIEAVGAAADFQELSAVEIVDAQGGLILPGLINSHTHLPMSLFRGLADDLPLEQWLQEYIFPAEAGHIDPRSVRLGARLSAAEMLLGGTTTCCDGYFLANDIAETVEAIGLRAILGQGVIDFPAPGVPDPAQKLRVAEGFAERWRGRSELIKPSIFCHAPYTCSDETLQTAKQTADRLGLLFQIHVAETQSEAEQCRRTHGCSPVRHLHRLGLLDPKTLLVHAVWVDPEDIEMIAASGARVVHCPESNMKLASGMAPIPELLRQQQRSGLVVGDGYDRQAAQGAAVGSNGHGCRHCP